MASLSRVLYVGMTGDLVRRVEEHKRGAVPGFTSRYRARRLVYYESFQQVAEALVREKQLKSWLRARKVALIEAVNPQWHDLAAHPGWWS
jgi:putative endonuclease